MQRNIMSDDTVATATETTPLTKSKPKPKESKSIRVICAGLGRTGTLSLTEALVRLGYKPYHYIDFRHASDWADLAEGRTGGSSSSSDAAVDVDVDAVIDRIVDDGYDAVLENPTCDIYTDILARFPDARVVLTVRDSPGAFAKSWKTLMDTMIVTEQDFSWSFPSFFGWIPLFRHLRSIRRFMGTTHLGLEPGALAHGWRDKKPPSGDVYGDDGCWLEEQYEKHNQHVIDHVPEEQLLVFNVKEGWEPLCRFLGCDGDGDIPEEDFPHCTVNNAASLQRLRTHFLAAVYGWIPATVLAATGAYFCLGRQGAGVFRAKR